MFFQEIGLNEGESLVYSDLLTNGESEARVIVERTGLGRGNTYNIVSLLERRGLIVAVHETVKTRYRAVDPSNLRKLLHQKQEVVRNLALQFDALLPNLTSQYALATGKPTIQIFEGLEGFAHVLDDSLRSKGEILTVVDSDAITEDILRVEGEYIQKRIKKGIHKRVLLADSASAREWVVGPGNAFTQSKIVSSVPKGFSSALQIYQDSISLLALRDRRIISLLITDVSFAALQRAMFEGLWSQA